MQRTLQLFESHISFVDFWEGNATIFFSHAYIHKSKGRSGRDEGEVLSQAAELVLYDITVFGSLPTLPNTVSEGYLEVGGVKHDSLPLPFKRKKSGILSLTFVDGSTVAIAGQKPHLELIGRPTFLDKLDQ